MNVATDSEHLGSERPGPAPVPQACVSDAQLRVLKATIDAGSLATIPYLANLLGGHPNTTRAHLEALVAAGFVSRETAAATGRGRPRHIYRATRLGIAALRPPAIAPEYAGLAKALANQIALTSADPEAAAIQAGHAWASTEDTPAGSDRMDVIEQALSTMGFTPEPRENGDATLMLHTCPLLDTALKNPQVICAVHRGLVEGTLRKNGMRYDDVELLPFHHAEGCMVRLTDEPQSAGSQVGDRSGSDG